jgi:hypothetical protein
MISLLKLSSLTPTNKGVNETGESWLILVAMNESYAWAGDLARRQTRD